MRFQASKTGLGAVALLLICFLLTAFCLPLPLLAAEEDVPLRAEPMIQATDDDVLCVKGYTVYVSGHEDLPLSLSYAVTKGEDTVSEKDPWISITDLQSETSEDEDAAEETEATEGDVEDRPTFIVEFLRPEDAEATQPAYLSSMKSDDNGASFYCLDPAYSITFTVTGGAADENGKYPFAPDPVECESGDGRYTFQLVRPQKLVARKHLSTDENVSSGIYTVSYLPKNIRDLQKKLEAGDTAFLSAYNLSDAALYIQYGFSTGTDPLAFDETSDTEEGIWDGGILLPLAGGIQLPLAGGIQHPLTDTASGSLYAKSFSLDDAEFRALFPEDFYETKEMSLADGGTENYYQVDFENETVNVYARYVLRLTRTDGTTYDCTSSFTDGFSCGAVNSLVSDPTAIDAPLLAKDSAYGLVDNKPALHFHVTPPENLREATVWSHYHNVFGPTPVVDVSVNGAEWKESTLLITGDLLADDALFAVELPEEASAEYAYIRVRMRYTLENEKLTLESPWSESVVFDKQPSAVLTEPETTAPVVSESETVAPGDLKYVCPVCGICPAPYGVCLFLWLGAALLIILLIVLIIALIPKKKHCPRCGADCKPADPACPVCGYRFVGNMPMIEDTAERDLSELSDDTEAEDAVLPADTEKDDPFAEDPFGVRPVKSAPVPTPKAAPAEKPTATKVAPAPAVSPETVEVKPAPTEKAEAPVSRPPETDAAFLSALRVKMAEAKAGGHPAFTPAEIAYIKALREKAATTAAKARAAETTSVAPVPAPTAPVTPAAPKTAEATAPAQPKYSPEQIARLRALRLKQQAAEATGEKAADGNSEGEEKATIQGEKAVPSATEVRADALKRVHKPEKQIKCSACAVPNPETNERCYICGHLLR